jgi:NAD(P)-dependent dehydrogenase (short-subunit alcohol dehydrogenase family)
MTKIYRKDNYVDKDFPVVIITGASRGLGAACAQIASQAGAGVVLCARSEQDLVELVDQILAEGSHALAVIADVSSTADCQRIVYETISRFGRIDALINNAGILEPIAPIATGEIGGWLDNIKINLLGAVMLSQASLPYLRNQSGRIINVSSGAAINVVPGWGAYCASKAALTHFTRVLAAEENEITTLSFRPGVIDTEMQATIRNVGKLGMQKDNYDYFVNLHSQGELLPPEIPARSLVALSLYAPRELSGKFISWDDEAVRQLVSHYLP